VSLKQGKEKRKTLIREGGPVDNCCKGEKEKKTVLEKEGRKGGEGKGMQGRHSLEGVGWATSNEREKRGRQGREKG